MYLCQGCGGQAILVLLHRIVSTNKGDFTSEVCLNFQKEDARVSKWLEYMRQRLTALEILEALPSNVRCRQNVIDRALDVRSASMLFLAAKIALEDSPSQRESYIH
jgi:hypothetical protein